MISTKSTYVKIDGWRGYMQPVNAVAGANDTGMWSDSPCPSNVRKKEISDYTKQLKKAGIQYKAVWKQSSNVFMMKRFVLVSPEDKAKALEIAVAHQKETTIFYAINDN